MKEKNKRKLLESLYELKERTTGRLEFIKESKMPKEEIDTRVHELNFVLNNIERAIHRRIKPLEELTSVRGTVYKIGDIFSIKGDPITVYEIVYFPDALTVRGRKSNPPIGKPWVVEAYIEDIFKPEKKKEVVPEKKRKKVKIKVGEYFKVYTHNAAFKAWKVTKKQVFGYNDMTFPNAVKSVGAFRQDIMLTTKEAYDSQHKLEKMQVTAGVLPEPKLIPRQKARRLK